MMSEAWYELAGADVPLTQGDLIFDCPLLTWDMDNLEQAGRGAALEHCLPSLLRAFREDVVVLTPACDLEHHKVHNVVLCPHVPLSAFRQIWHHWMQSRNQNPAEKAWRRTCQDIADGYVWNQTSLIASSTTNSARKCASWTSTTSSPSRAPSWKRSCGSVRNHACDCWLLIANTFPRRSHGSSCESACLSLWTTHGGGRMMPDSSSQLTE